MNLYKDDKTGNVVELIYTPEEVEEITINGNPLRKLKAGESDGAGEKHVPFVQKEGDELRVQVGEVKHPMLDTHYITNIWVEYPDGTVDRKVMKPGEEPVAVFDIKDQNGTAKVYEYCNLHGLWSTDVVLD